MTRNRTTPKLAAIVRTSQMGGRAVGSARFHADEEQVADVERYARELGAEVEFMEPELDVSGGLPIDQRPALRAAIEGVEAGIYDGIMGAYLSRLTRSRSGHKIWERVEAAGGRVYTARERLDTSTVEGRRQRDYAIANAVAEREEAAERFDRRVRLSTEAGIWQRRQTPTGYDKGPDRRLTPNADAPKVRQAFRDRAAGASLQSLAQRFGMTRHGMSKLLRNRVYLGELHIGEYVNRKAHPAIVSISEFEAAQTSQPRPPRSPEFSEPALLQGIVRCGGCGHPMSRHRGSVVTYTCQFNNKREPCPAPAVVSLHLLDALIERYGRLTWEGSVLIEGGEYTGADELLRAAEDADAEIAAFIAQTSARTPGYAEGLRAREEAAAEAWTAYRRAASASPIREIAGEEWWDNATDADRNAYLTFLGFQVTVFRAGGVGARTPLDKRVKVEAHGRPVRLRELERVARWRRSLGDTG